MKILLTILSAFIVSTSASASAPAGDEKCGAETSTTCTDASAKKDAHHGDAHHGGGHHGGGHHGGLSEKMNSLYPELQKDGAFSARPAATQITAPSFMAGVAAGSVKLEWKEVAGATDYHVQVATDPQFKWIVANEYFVKGTTYEFTKAEAGQKYFWRVASFKADNKASYTKSNFVSSVFIVK